MYVRPPTPLLVTRYRVADARWTLKALRIVVVSDVHCCWPWLPPARVAGIAEEANGLGGDLILLAGDYLIDPMQRLFARFVPAPVCLDALRGLRAPLGVYSVLGNHDWGDCPEARRNGYRTNTVIEALAASGIPLLQNRAVALSHAGSQFWLVGTDSQRAINLGFRKGYTSFLDADAAFAEVPADAPAIHLAHEPDYFAEADPRAFLQISGHTHGGQIKLLGRTPVVPSDYGARYVGGYYHENGNHLVVSRGIGSSGLPLRLGVPPEIVVIDIVGVEEDPNHAGRRDT